MKKSEILELMRLVVASYPRAKITPATTEAYCALLLDLDHEATERAIVAHIATSVFFPAVSEIREAVVEYSLELPTGPEAWTYVLEAVKHSGRGFSIAESSWPREVQDAVRTIGWLALCTATNPTQTRAAFIKAYEAIRRRSVIAMNLVPLFAARRMLSESPPQFMALTTPAGDGPCLCNLDPPVTCLRHPFFRATPEDES